MPASVGVVRAFSEQSATTRDEFVELVLLEQNLGLLLEQIIDFSR